MPALPPLYPHLLAKLTFVISKGKGLSLEFSYAAYPDEVTIDSMSVRENKESDDEMLAYEGPDFRVNNWTCINFAKNVQDNLARGFCHELAQICQISGMVGGRDTVLVDALSRRIPLVSD
ncbi:hypothetical protein ZIOFF_055587 [Zingiber officinale]|uniref:Uncharacterized protein n=1 Tax=Zingiber officinale TaxID=94328 RepID=A0A8J5FGP6_ZINOF|nr:hypothetical protein ZIOFF_055587 [Zingiber officinale]